MNKSIKFLVKVIVSTIALLIALQVYAPILGLKPKSYSCMGSTFTVHGASNVVCKDPDYPPNIAMTINGINVEIEYRIETINQPQGPVKWLLFGITAINKDGIYQSTNCHTVDGMPMFGAVHLVNVMEPVSWDGQCKIGGTVINMTTTQYP